MRSNADREIDRHPWTGPKGFSGSWWRYCCAFLISMPSWPSHASIARRKRFKKRVSLPPNTQRPEMAAPRMELREEIHARCSRPAAVLASDLHSSMGTHVSPILYQFILKSSPALDTADIPLLYVRQALHQKSDNGPRKNIATRFVARKTNKSGLHGSFFALRAQNQVSDLEKWGVYLCSNLRTRSWLLEPRQIDRNAWNRLCNNQLWSDRMQASIGNNTRKRLVRTYDKDR